jgi:hypothetical protein
MNENIDIDYQNGVAEDLGALLGYCAASRFMAVFGGQKIMIPREMRSGHLIGRVVGEPAFARLCAEYGGEQIKVPAYMEAELMRRYHAVAEMILDGTRAATIARVLSVSERTVNYYRVKAESLGLLPMVLKDRPRDGD